MSHTRSFFIGAALLAVLCTGRALARDRTIVFSTHMPEDSLIYAKSYAVMKEAFRRLGMGFAMKIYPGHRALELSNAGETDGEASRIPGLEREYPNLIMIPEVQQRVVIRAFTTKSDIEVPNGWSDLRGHEVVYVRGIPFIRNKLREYGVEAHEVNSHLLQFEFLKLGRADVFISGEEALPSSLSEEDRDMFRQIDPPLSVIELFAYVNVDNADLVVPLVRTLREMKADGTYERLMQSLSEQQ